MSTYVRRSVYALGEPEKVRLRDAFQALYDQVIAPDQDLVNPFPKKYQELAGILNAFGHYERNDLLFLPWARAYFWWFEQAMRKVAPQISLPYWDYTSEEALDKGLPSLFTDETYVNGDGREAPNPLLRARYKYPFNTYREVHSDTNPLKVAAEVSAQAMKNTDFVGFSLGIYPADIGSHLYIGGSSANTHSTSYDPVFWFTHCQLDHFWWQWQNLNGYEAPKSVLAAELLPFTNQQGSKKVIMKGSSVMNTTDLGYTYDG